MDVDLDVMEFRAQGRQSSAGEKHGTGQRLPSRAERPPSDGVLSADRSGYRKQVKEKHADTSQPEIDALYGSNGFQNSTFNFQFSILQYRHNGAGVLTECKLDVGLRSEAFKTVHMCATLAVFVWVALGYLPKGERHIGSIATYLAHFLQPFDDGTSNEGVLDAEIVLPTGAKKNNVHVLLSQPGAQSRDIGKATDKREVGIGATEYADGAVGCAVCEMNAAHIMTEVFGRRIAVIGTGQFPATPFGGNFVVFMTVCFERFETVERHHSAAASLEGGTYCRGGAQEIYGHCDVVFFDCAEGIECRSERNFNLHH